MLTPVQPSAPQAGAPTSGFSSLPVVPAQPAQLAYSPADLELFEYPNPASPGGAGTLTRALYMALTGAQAPPYDSTNPTRNWYDQSANPGYPSPGSYVVIEVNGSATASISSISVPANVQAPNLPGPYQYPAWENPSTTIAQITFPGFPAQPLPATFLCLESDAQAVAAALPAGTTVGEDSTDFMVTWSTEPRRRYTVSVPNGPQQVYAAPLRAAMTQVLTGPNGNYISGGVGSPGTFTVSGINMPTWAPVPDPGLSAGPAMPIPCRPLISNGADQEILVPGPLGIGVQVVRLDYLASSSGVAGGGLTVEQGAWVLEALQAIGESLKLNLPAPPSS